MDKFLLLSENDKQAYFGVAADNLNVMPQLIEKDFWICWILRILFSLPESGSHLTFKGGTSLSKCYNIIKRFSEDVDISIERSFFSTAESIEPEKEQSGKENRRRLDRLRKICQEKISEVIIPALRDKINRSLPALGKWSIELDPKDLERQTVLFIYPYVVKTSTESYMKPFVKIEFGARSDHWPIETINVIPYVSDVPGIEVIEGISVRVLGAERTFWEKVTILHAIRHGSKSRARMSRHYYDVFAMLDSPIFDKAMGNIDLLLKVAEHKALYFRDPKAHYDLAKPGSLRLLPKDEDIVQLNTDYEHMQQMFFEDPPSFESILEKLQIVEDKINRIK